MSFGTARPAPQRTTMPPQAPPTRPFAHAQEAPRAQATVGYSGPVPQTPREQMDIVNNNPNISFMGIPNPGWACFRSTTGFCAHRLQEHDGNGIDYERSKHSTHVLHICHFDHPSTMGCTTCVCCACAQNKPGHLLADDWSHLGSDQKHKKKADEFEGMQPRRRRDHIKKVFLV